MQMPSVSPLSFQTLTTINQLVPLVISPKLQHCFLATIFLSFVDMGRRPLKVQGRVLSHALSLSNNALFGNI